MRKLRLGNLLKESGTNAVMRHARLFQPIANQIIEQPISACDTRRLLVNH
ncbi:MAG: hypothetical protein ACNYPI_08575 [Arenicellales bacterium WSBS_2016_MAG_OTU3]